MGVFWVGLSENGRYLYMMAIIFIMGKVMIRSNPYGYSCTFLRKCLEYNVLYVGGLSIFSASGHGSLGNRI